jgi:hypothetical protein
MSLINLDEGVREYWRGLAPACPRIPFPVVQLAVALVSREVVSFRLSDASPKAIWAVDYVLDEHRPFLQYQIHYNHAGDVLQSMGDNPAVLAWYSVLETIWITHAGYWISRTS